MSDLVVIQRLVLIAVLAGLIGFERERHGRAAGFRTHILVGVGSCLIMLTGLHLMEALAGRATFDPTRMAAQVVSGIGFLGAGTILRFRASVRGLTTAASLWAIGGVGLAVGSGFILGAVTASLVIVLTLFGFSRLEQAMRRDVYQTLAIETKTPGELLVKVRQILAEYEVEIRDFQIQEPQANGVSRIELDLKLLTGRSQQEILDQLQQLEHMRRAHWV